MKKFKCLSSLFSICLFMGASILSFGQKLEPAETILSRYAQDYENDISLKEDVTFGIEVDTTFWHVIATAKSDANPASVKLLKGKPAKPSFYFTTDLETLNKIEKGELNALTASAKAFSSDVTPFDVEVMEGYTPSDNFLNRLLNVYFHFWTRGMPERIPFGLDKTRYTHGAQAAIFYYQPGFRSGYFALKKGQHANEDEKSRTNPFPSMFIAIKGEGDIIINGERSKLAGGEAILIPPGVSHQFINNNEEVFEGIILMFGEGA
ncbi:MAG: cupin domain-containing protein [Flavobacteriaceae bacterium]|nr:cupin domain-containing protein [Flavobacteriaceae bacterium]